MHSYYLVLEDVVRFVHDRMPELRLAVRRMLEDGLPTGVARAVVRRGEEAVSVSYHFGVSDFLEFLTLRHLTADAEARRRLVESVLSVMEGLRVSLGDGGAVSIREYVESSGVSWEAFKESLRRGLEGSIESYAELLSSGSGSPLAKHIHFREEALRSGRIYDYWITRLSGELGLALLEYHAELELSSRAASKLRGARVSSPRYLVGLLGARAAIKDLAHVHAEMLRHLGHGGEVEGFSIKDDAKLWLGGKLGRVIGALARWRDEVARARDRSEEVAAAVLKDLEARAMHRISLELPLFLPDSELEKLRTVDRRIVDKALEGFRDIGGREEKEEAAESAA